MNLFKSTNLIKYLVPLLVILFLTNAIFDNKYLVDIVTLENWKIIFTVKLALNFVCLIIAIIITYLSYKNKTIPKGGRALFLIIYFILFTLISANNVYNSSLDLFQGEKEYIGNCQIVTDRPIRSTTDFYYIRVISENKTKTIQTSYELYEWLKGERLNSMLDNHYECKGEMRIKYLRYTNIVVQAK